MYLTLARCQGLDEARRKAEQDSQGIELGLLGHAGAVDWFFGYSFIAATYESEETLASVVDPEGIAVEEGDRLPGIPEHNLKLGLEWAATGYLCRSHR